MGDDDESGAPDFPPSRPMSREKLEMLLIEIRDGASATLGSMAVEEIKTGTQNEAKIGDARAVWHATEVALGILLPGYVPRHEALEDVEHMLAWINGKDADWPSTD